MLHHLKRNHSRNQRESWLILLIERFDLVEGAERVLLLTLVELLVQAEFVLLLEDAAGEGETLRAMLGVRDRAQVVAESTFVFLAVGELGDAAGIADFAVVVHLVGREDGVG